MSAPLTPHPDRRAFFKAMDATSTDHGHPIARTADLPPAEAEALARMSLDDGFVMQLHPGSFRNHHAPTFATFGRDKGADLPRATDYVRGLKPLLDRFGDAPGFTLILFTLDETVYSRELAPLAGFYPCLRLGPAWWFHDSPEGLMRFREQTTEIVKQAYRL